MKSIRHFIWDFDGTLFDTYPVIIENLNQALEEFGGSCEPVETMKLMLQNIPTAQKFYAEKYGIPRQVLVDAYERYHQIANREMVARPMEGLTEVLAKIRDTGRHNYIFTHRKDSETRQYLEKYGLTEYFREIMGPEAPGFAWKPAPDAVLHLMEKYAMTEADALMVGDRDCDLGSARNAHIRTAHLVCAVAPEELDCDFRLQSLAQMLKML